MESKKIKEWLMENGYVLGPKDSAAILEKENYGKIDFNPGAVIGLVLHSMLSGRPRPDFYTDGSAIYYQASKKFRIGEQEMTAQKQEDLLRELEVMSVITPDVRHLKYHLTCSSEDLYEIRHKPSIKRKCVKPRSLGEEDPFDYYNLRSSEDLDYDFLFEEVDGHLRAANFQQIYDIYLIDHAGEGILEKYKDHLKNSPRGVISREERGNIKFRIKKNREYIQDFLRALKEEEPPIPEYAKKIAANLEELSGESFDLHSFHPRGAR